MTLLRAHVLIVGVWTAAHAFHPVGSLEAETFAAQTLTANLHGVDAYLAYHHTREHQRTYPEQHDYQLGA
ncbi:hypothetical protein AB0C90_15800 [Streptomyces sp. NPDC048550]|uniref:hypothetical protein n=1 Tax=Streptomyces sp. NPDC048550 TaxID=3155739 RepID=UPI0034436DF7